LHDLELVNNPLLHNLSFLHRFWKPFSEPLAFDAGLRSGRAAAEASLQSS
jgi:hypothetical protein